MKRCLAALAVALIAAGCGTSRSGTPNSPHPKGWGFPTAPRSVQLLAPGTTATMYDSIELSTVPRDPFALAGYTSGRWPTFVPMTRRWPSAHVVSIAVFSWNHADCLDVEPGDAPAWIAPSWVRADKAAGWPKPCLYSSWYEFVTEVRPALQRAGIPRSTVWEWSADYTYRPHIDAGFDGTQYTDRAFGLNLDASVVTRAFLAIAHPPLIPPHPKPAPPKPKPNARIAYLRSLARKHGCYSVASHERFVPGWGWVRVRKPHACVVWGAEVRHLEGR